MYDSLSSDFSHHTVELADLGQEVLQWRRKNLYMVIKHGKVNIWSARGSYDYTAYLFTAGPGALLAKLEQKLLATTLWWIQSSWHLLLMALRAESGSWNNLTVRLPGCGGSFVGSSVLLFPNLLLVPVPCSDRINVRVDGGVSDISCRGWVRPCAGFAWSHSLVGGVSQSGRWGLSFVLNKEKNWGSAAVGWSGAPSKELGFRWPGNELSIGCPAAQLRVIKAGMTCHSRTCCKSPSDEFTNKMPVVLNSRRHVSPAGCSSSAWRGEQPWRGRHCSLRLCWHGAQLLSSRDPGECCAGQTGGCCL